MTTLTIELLEHEITRLRTELEFKQEIIDKLRHHIQMISRTAEERRVQLARTNYAFNIVVEAMIRSEEVESKENAKGVVSTSGYDQEQMRRP